MPLVTACLLVACGKQADTPSAPPEVAPGAEEGQADPNATPGAEEGHDDPNATPSDGPPENCDFQVKDECYTDHDAACAAAGCEPDKCVVLESYPAQIECG